MDKIGGYKKIFKDLVGKIKSLDITDIAKSMDLVHHPSGSAEIPFLGATYLLSESGLMRKDGKEVSSIYGSVLAGYLLKGEKGEGSSP